MLHKEGNNGSYIKLRMRWLSDCFEKYLQNTQRICEQHNDAMLTGNEIMLMALTEVSDIVPQAAIYSEWEFAQGKGTYCHGIVFSIPLIKITL